MSNYVTSNLLKGEQVIQKGMISPLAMISDITLGCILLPFLIGPLFWIRAIIILTTTELTITNKRIVAKTGLIRRVSIELPLLKVESIQIHQGIFGRLLGYGNILISGTGTTQTDIPCINNPMQFRTRSMQVLDWAEHQRKG